MDRIILLVDDSKALREGMKSVLENEGFTVLLAEDGEDALLLLDGRKIHLIISDVNMPKMDGLTFVKKIKNDSKYNDYKFTPVIMLTTESGYDMKKEGKVSGVKVWVTKPFEPEKLVSAISMLLI